MNLDHEAIQRAAYLRALTHRTPGYGRRLTITFERLEDGHVHALRGGEYLMPWQDAVRMIRDGQADLDPATLPI